MNTSVRPNNNRTVTDGENTGFRFHQRLKRPECSRDDFVHEWYCKKTKRQYYWFIITLLYTFKLHLTDIIWLLLYPFISTALNQHYFFFISKIWNLTLINCLSDLSFLSVHALHQDFYIKLRPWRGPVATKVDTILTFLVWLENFNLLTYLYKRTN